MYNSEVLVVGIEFVAAGGTVTPAPSGVVSVNSIDDILETQNAKYVLKANINAGDVAKQFTNCTVTIDLAGHTWTSNNNVVLTGDGADVTIIDSVGGGKLVSTGNDAIQPDAGKLTLNGITVESKNTDGDALFVNGGTVILRIQLLLLKKQVSI